MFLSLHHVRHAKTNPWSTYRSLSSFCPPLPPTPPSPPPLPITTTSRQAQCIIITFHPQHPIFLLSLLLTARFLRLSSGGATNTSPRQGYPIHPDTRVRTVKPSRVGGRGVVNCAHYRLALTLTPPLSTPWCLHLFVSGYPLLHLFHLHPSNSSFVIPPSFILHTPSSSLLYLLISHSTSFSSILSPFTLIILPLFIFHSLPFTLRLALTPPRYPPETLA